MHAMNQPNNVDTVRDLRNLLAHLDREMAALHDLLTQGRKIRAELEAQIAIATAGNDR